MPVATEPVVISKIYSFYLHICRLYYELRPGRYDQ